MYAHRRFRSAALPNSLIIVFAGQSVGSRGSKASSENVNLGPVVQSVVSLTSSLRVISLTVLADSIYSILIFLLKNVSACTAKATHIFFQQKFQHICVSPDVNFNDALTNDNVSFKQLGQGHLLIILYQLIVSI